ncbi:hypothetical protein B0G80_4800 [Paraburkholderia sp. BL6669N2]|nr:hypothetical protein B0G80_4800 [Paraburkholderia sp. BL6669N2]
MNREIHVRFWEGLWVRFPWATHLDIKEMINFLVVLISATPMLECSTTLALRLAVSERGECGFALLEITAHSQECRRVASYAHKPVHRRESYSSTTIGELSVPARNP